jgi:hypothetical protein
LSGQWDGANLHLHRQPVCWIVGGDQKEVMEAAPQRQCWNAGMMECKDISD